MAVSPIYDWRRPFSSLRFLSETFENPTVFDSGSCPQLVRPQNTAYFGHELASVGRALVAASQIELRDRSSNTHPGEEQHILSFILRPELFGDVARAHCIDAVSSQYGSASEQASVCPVR